MLLSNLLGTRAIPLRRMHVPLYLPKFSKKHFTVRQHVLISVVKELERKSYRGLHNILEDYSSIAKILKLKRILHGNKNTEGEGTA